MAPGEEGEIEVRVGAARGMGRAVVSPSSLEGGGKVRLDGLLTVGGESGMERGTLVHRWLELVEWLEEGGGGLPTREAMLAAVGEVAMSAGEVERVMVEFAGFCAKGEIRKLLTRPNLKSGESVEVWRERGFAVPMEHPVTKRVVTVAGMMDRVVVRRAGGKVVGAELIDFKTDGVRAETMAEVVKHYQPQVVAYRRALAKMLGVEKVAGKLAFVRARVVVDV